MKRRKKIIIEWLSSMLIVLGVITIFFIGDGYNISNKSINTKKIKYPTIKLDDSVLNSVHLLIEDKNKLSKTKNILLFNNNSLSNVNRQYVDSIKKINEDLKLNKNYLLKINKSINDENLKNKIKIDSLNYVIVNLNDRIEILTNKYNRVIKDSFRVKLVIDTVYLEKIKVKKKIKR